MTHQTAAVGKVKVEPLECQLNNLDLSSYRSYTIHANETMCKELELFKIPTVRNFVVPSIEAPLFLHLFEK